NYDWPGNIRELENTIKSLMVLSQGELLEHSNLPKRIKACIVSGSNNKGSRKNNFTILRPKFSTINWSICIHRLV
ncbi:MAG: hypothetical protein ACUZ8H_11335, partial [Candidatus Anammoxibacter sp.]